MFGWRRDAHRQWPYEEISFEARESETLGHRRLVWLRSKFPRWRRCSWWWETATKAHHARQHADPTIRPVRNKRDTGTVAAIQMVFQNPLTALKLRAFLVGSQRSCVRWKIQDRHDGRDGPGARPHVRACFDLVNTCRARSPAAMPRQLFGRPKASIGGGARLFAAMPRWSWRRAGSPRSTSRCMRLLTELV